MGNIRFPPGAQNIIARAMHPEAWQYQEWSSAVADQIQDARVSAYKMMRNDPEKALRIIAEWRAQSLEEKASAIRNDPKR